MKTELVIVTLMLPSIKVQLVCKESSTTLQIYKVVTKTTKILRLT